MTNNKMPPCPFCGEAMNVDSKRRYFLAYCSGSSDGSHGVRIEGWGGGTIKEFTAELRAKLSGHRIGDDLYRRVVEVIQRLSAKVMCGSRYRGATCDCPSSALCDDAHELLSELGAAKGDAEVDG